MGLTIKHNAEHLAGTSSTLPQSGYAVLANPKEQMLYGVMIGY